MIAISVGVDFILAHVEWSDKNIVNVAIKVAKTLIVTNDVWDVGDGQVASGVLIGDNIAIKVETNIVSVVSDTEVVPATGGSSSYSLTIGRVPETKTTAERSRSVNAEDSGIF